MILKYGTYSHDQNEATIVIARSQLDTAGGQGAGYKEMWRVKGCKHADTQAALTTALAALELAYFYNGRDLALYLDDGTTLTNHALISSTSFTGVKVVAPVSYPDGERAEYSTYRNYEIGLEAEFRVTGSNAQLDAARLQSWNETLSFQGTGGPLFKYLLTINGAWQKQQVTDRSNYFVTQRGQAVGKTGYPTPRGPIWPDAEHVEQRNIEYQSADRNGGQLENYPVSWSYSFESEQALSGQPQQWP